MYRFREIRRRVHLPSQNFKDAIRPEEGFKVNDFIKLHDEAIHNLTKNPIQALPSQHNKTVHSF
jgi:hypothetical protein